MTGWIEDTAALEALYGTPRAAATVKVADRITPAYRAWIEASPFCILSTVGPEGLDGSPRGDDGPVVAVLDEATLALPDRRGNDRIDSLRNIVRDPRVALMFLIPGAGTVIRVNGSARISAAADLLDRFASHGKPPRSVVVVSVQEVYFQCARAVMRARLWDGGIADPAALPTPGRMLETMSGAAIDGDAYDRDWPGRAAGSLW
ncbi:pyridoxamine 5'-phosphate oxidase family protein [Rhodobacteraceae bacterium 2CG4]|uniref:Pyridoxamine 5'-phosphate oxidase family protein n=1 Tax=Halovulum marinum TaxID=2662447 RepID=A0A6L5Z2X4_9RHOB|nr:pyridoxamine 5'-phosphate oxidase family protein [Halovulum marinum]MSU90629.1 pyridoxamine 5'-phosphate oxidase family protein [Halovulum marinum]